MKGTTTSWIVAGVGTAVSGIGLAMRRSNLSKLGTGILGFGLAHVVLGVLDQFRPSVKQ